MSNLTLDGRLYIDYIGCTWLYDVSTIVQSSDYVSICFYLFLYNWAVVM